MCSSRLAVDEAPACVQACPNEAIRITVVDRLRVIEDSEANVFLPGAAEPDYTLPTTNYKTTRALPRNLLPADYHQVAPQHAHLPLVVMLVLTQLSVGAFAVAQLLAWRLDPALTAELRPVQAAVALALGMLALGASVLHLGRPLYAYRAIVGLRTSWLSREILVFGAFAGLASVYATASWLPSRVVGHTTLNALGTVVACVGAVGVFCSVMIYHDTRRPFWHFRYTASKFLLSSLLLGLATTLLTMIAAAYMRMPGSADALRLVGAASCTIIAGFSLLKIALALLTLRHLRDRQQTPMKRTARLAIGPLRLPVVARLVLAAIGGVALPLMASGTIARGNVTTPLLIVVAVSFAMTLASELLERYLFFTAVVAPKMPGGLGS
jgi:DMSO reductase anchor subunit